jgi:hypothetical protein
LVVVVVAEEVVVVTCGNEVLVVVRTVTFGGIGGVSAGLGDTAGPVRVPRSAAAEEAPISDRTVLTVGVGCVAAG